MSELAIKVEGLGKKYIIGHQKSGDLREAFARAIKNLFSASARTHETFWALKDVSFEIKKGEAVGIIGRNGAGKSTLLKLLSRITEPTTGRFEINGRVSSLLEVGTGFHPELTGRENIFLNGTILGMRRTEIKAKFDEIVDFSGVEKFIDTPVKHYSSGMKVRLAFSVAAHLEPEILIVDEVLAVGDAEFQKKCLGKMDEVSKNEGRTILFVSHNMSALKTLCVRGICIEKGKINYEGSIYNAVEQYMAGNTLMEAREIANYQLNDGCSLERFYVGGNDVETLSDLEFLITIKSLETNYISELSLLFYNEFQERVAILDLRDDKLYKLSEKSNRLVIEGTIRDIPLIEGKYLVGLYLASNLCTGNFLELVKLVITGKKHFVAPYPVNVRGFVEMRKDFRVYV